MSATNIFGQKMKNSGLRNKTVVKGEFSTYKINHKELRIYKLNKFMSYCLLFFVVLSMASYVLVITKETFVKRIHSKTASLLYENIDLQNKVDNLKSFYSIDNKVSKVNFLKKADKIIEIKDLDPPVKLKKIISKNNPKQVPAGF